VLRSYLPAIVFLALGGIVGGTFAYLNTVIGPRRRIAAKIEPYECGLPSEVKYGFRFGISFYLIAMLFILFDIENHLPLPNRRRAARIWQLRAARGDHVRRAALRRVRVRVATWSARVAVTRESVGDPNSFRARGLLARDLLRGDLEDWSSSASSSSRS